MSTAIHCGLQSQAAVYNVIVQQQINKKGFRQCVRRNIDMYSKSHLVGNHNLLKVQFVCAEKNMLTCQKSLLLLYHLSVSHMFQEKLSSLSALQDTMMLRVEKTSDLSPEVEVH